MPLAIARRIVVSTMPSIKLVRKVVDPEHLATNNETSQEAVDNDDDDDDVAWY